MAAKKQLLYLIFIIAVLSGLFLFFMKALLSPVEIVAYENRSAVSLPALTEKSYSDGSFQADFETALADQLPLASKFKKLYNILDSYAALPLVRKLLGEYDMYIPYRSVAFYKDRIVAEDQFSEDMKLYIRNTAESITRCSELAPDVDFYLYYIQNDSDINLASGKNSGMYEALRSGLELPDENISCLEINSFEQFDELFLKTDHHWNHLGSRKAYLDLCSMLGIAPLDPTGLHTEYACYHGTRAAGIEAYPMEDFSVFDYDYPEMSFIAEGEAIADYGLQKSFINGELESFSYGSIFGGDYDELIIDTGRPGSNILILGDSYDNPILKCFASSYSKTFSIDMRGFCSEGLASFDMSSFIRENDIDTVLFIGGGSFFINTLNGRS